MAAWYDPLGLICPITIRLKIELSKVVARSGLGWDDKLPAEFRETWMELLEYMVELPTFTFHQSARPIGAQGRPEVIAFWDGANPAYAASIYLRWMVQPPDDCKS